MAAEPERIRHCTRLSAVALSSVLALAAADGDGASSTRTLEIEGIASGPVLAFTEFRGEGPTPTTTLKLSLRPQAMGAAFFSFLDAAFDGRSPTRSGRIVTYERRAASEIVQFRDAAALEVRFPKLDVASSEEVRVEVVLASASVQNKPGDASSLPSMLSKRVPSVTRASFHLTIEGVDCSGVATVEAITISTGALPSEPTGMTGPPLGPGRRSLGGGEVAISPLAIEVATSTLSSFQKWLADGNQRTRSGKLEFRTTDQKPSYVVAFSKLSITKISAGTRTPQGERARIDIAVRGARIASSAGVVR